MCVFRRAKKSGTTIVLQHAAQIPTLMKQIYPVNITSAKALEMPLTRVEILKKFTLLLLLSAFALSALAQNPTDTTPTPELVFVNPVLVSGTANKQGAIYRFNNVTTGVDAEIRLKKFSRNDIVMSNIDLATMGWNKAFQPQFGLPGYVSPNQHWFIDFELTFFEAGKNVRRKMQRFDLTSLDVDGDGVTIAEYVKMDNANAVNYSTLSFLTGTGNDSLIFTCHEDDITSAVIDCDKCDHGLIGTIINGIFRGNECTHCNGSGKVFSSCDHAWAAETTVQGPVLNFANIDTAATQVMATYTYLNKEKITFRMGAKSGSVGSNGAGIRLNSMWYRSFSLAPQATLPVKLTEFTATYKNDKVKLNWASAQENQFSHFVVERSNDGKNFTEMGLVFSTESMQARKEYTFTDANVSSKANMIYYRLKMVDIDQQTSYSSVRIIRFRDQKADVTISTYPNPAVNEIRVTLPSTWQDNGVSFIIYNQNGQAVKQVNNNKAGQTQIIDIKDLPTGIFFIKAATATEQVTNRFIKTK